jgi:pSer/pThr/pTyr-binding forkhead associated (FHA) protein
MGTPAARLEVVSGKTVGQSILVADELVLGRHADGPGRLSDDEEVSRLHARITLDQSGVCEVEDLGSTNGTYVNGLRISEPEVLSVGDTIEVGQTTLAVRELPTSRRPSSSRLFFPEEDMEDEHEDEDEPAHERGPAASHIPTPVPAGPAADDLPEPPPDHVPEPAGVEAAEPASEGTEAPATEILPDSQPKPPMEPGAVAAVVPQPEGQEGPSVPEAPAPALSLQLHVDFDKREAHVSLQDGSDPVRFRFEEVVWRFVPPQPSGGPDAP